MQLLLLRLRLQLCGLLRLRLRLLLLTTLLLERWRHIQMDDVIGPQRRAVAIGYGDDVVVVVAANLLRWR